MTVGGAYGLALPGFPGDRWLAPAAPTWPEWEFAVEATPGADALTDADDVAVVRTSSGHAQRIDGTRRRTTLYGSFVVPEHAYVHPILANTAAAYAEWSGRLCFHAGAFLDGRGRAWGVLGDREHGKSSALAWLASNGVSVVADDIVITDGETVMAGPRCIDLREPTATALGLGEDIGLVGMRHRWRVQLPPIEPEVPLAGWVSLEWSDHLEVHEIAPEERGAVLAPSLALAVGRHPLPWLGVLPRPMVRLSRPKAWERLDAAMTLLLERVAELGQR